MQEIKPVMPTTIQPAYTTEFGATYCGDSQILLKELPDNSVDLVLTSPPFALQRQKSYGNKDQSEYVDWLLEFCKVVHAKLKNTGSFVIDMGGAYQKGLPIRSLYNFRFLLRVCDELGFFLAEEFYWYNPSKLPSPIEWVNKRKIRAKDAVNTVWWLSKTEWPQADVSNVLTEYSDRMKKLLKNPAKYYSPKERPSGHDISDSFGKDNGGAIPSNLLQIPNSRSSGKYENYCNSLNIDRHPARFPEKLPEFFIRFLTKPNDVVVDIFGGSNTLGEVAEREGRRWLMFEEKREYIAASAFRFIDCINIDLARDCYDRIMAGEAVFLDDTYKNRPSLFAVKVG